MQRSSEEKIAKISQIVGTVMNNCLNADYCWSCWKKFFCKKYSDNILPLFNLCREHEEMGAALIDINDILEDEDEDEGTTLNE